MISTRLHLFSLVLCTALACLAPAVRGQPAVFIDVGSINPPSVPPSAQLYVDIPRLFDFGIGGEPGEVLTVKWLKFSVATPIEGELYLDIDSRITTAGTVPGDLFMALYDGAGNLVATDDTDGSHPGGLAAGLSFGSTVIRPTPTTPALAGQDGNLGVGEYWLALLAGSASEATAGASEWSASTTGGYQLGFFSGGTYYTDLSISVGNTTPLPPPSNDDCSNALTIGENSPSGEPAWSGTNAGATNDGILTCSPSDVPAANLPKTIWFNYIPTQTGFVEVIARLTENGPSTILARYPDGCDTIPSECVGDGPFIGIADRETRLFFPVVAGEPVLLSLGVRAGYFGPMTLDVNLLPPPCELTIPAGAVAEREGACGDLLNDGCNYSPQLFDTIELGQVVHGKLFNNLQVRDTDWFEFTVPERSNVTVSFAAQYPSEVVILTAAYGDDCFYGEAVLEPLKTSLLEMCETTTGSTELEAGTYRVLIYNRYFDGFDCGAGYEQYWLSLSGQAVLVACGESDIAGPGQSVGFDGELTADDIIVYLNGFFAGDPVADVAGPGQSTELDGDLTADDIIVFLNRFFAGC